MPLSPDGVQVLAWEVSPNLKFEEFLRAEGLALMDYTRKSHTKGYVVSLSGGADSVRPARFLRPTEFTLK